MFGWLIYPPPNWYLLTTWDTFNRQGIIHIQQSGGGDKRNANKSQSRSFRFLLYMCPLQRAVCAKLPCGGQSSIWRLSETRGPSALDSRRNHTRCVSTSVRGLFLLTNEKYLQLEWFVDHVCRGLRFRPAQMEITHWRQLVDPPLYKKEKKVVFVIPDALKNHFRLSTLCEVFCLNGARRRQTTSLIRHRWRTADTTGTLGYLQE